MNSADCPPDTISPVGEKLGACAKPCIQEIFRPQNRGALAQAAPATSRAQDDLRLLRFHNGFCLQNDWSAIDARRAGERKLTRLQASPALETLRGKRVRHQPAQAKFVDRNDRRQVVLSEIVVNHAKSRHYDA
jgi:hypothetical protein